MARSRSFNIDGRHRNSQHYIQQQMPQSLLENVGNLLYRNFVSKSWPE